MTGAGGTSLSRRQQSLRALATLAILLGGTLLSLNQNDYWLRITSIALNFAIVALAWDLLLGYTGQLNFAPAAIWGAGGYTAAMLIHHLDLDPWLALAAAILVGAFLGLLLTVPAIRLQRLYLGLFTLAFGELLRLAAINESAFTLGLQGIGLSSVTFTGPLAANWSFQIFLLVVLIALYFLLRLLLTSRYGLYLQAVREDQQAAEARGIDTRLYKAVSFSLASAIMAFAGALFVYQIRYVSPDMLHVDYSFQFIVMALFGGVGTLIGPIVGALSITFLMEILREWEHLRLILLGMIVVANILFFPQGVIGYAYHYLQHRRTDRILRQRFRKLGAEEGEPLPPEIQLPRS